MARKSKTEVTENAALQAPDSNPAGAPEVTTNDSGDTESARVKIAEHGYLDKDGKACDDEESAVAITYQIIRDKASGNKVDLPAFSYTYGQNPEADRMLALFGAKTLSTNESSAARNRKEDPADAAGQMEAVRERFALINTGKWVDRTREGVGAKIDLDALTAAIVEVAAAAGRALDPVTILQKLTDDPTFKKTVRQVPDIAKAYAARIGKQEKTLDEALAGL